MTPIYVCNDLRCHEQLLLVWVWRRLKNVWPTSYCAYIGQHNLLAGTCLKRPQQNHYNHWEEKNTVWRAEVAVACFSSSETVQLCLLFAGSAGMWFNELCNCALASFAQNCTELHSISHLIKCLNLDIFRYGWGFCMCISVYIHIFFIYTCIYIYIYIWLRGRFGRYFLQCFMASFHV